MNNDYFNLTNFLLIVLFIGLYMALNYILAYYYGQYRRKKAVRLGQAFLVNFTKFKVGGIYNKTYVGNNEAYKKQNGKTTFEIVRFEKDGDKFYAKDLYAQFPRCSSERLDTNDWSWTITYLMKNTDYEYEEVFNEDHYYKHSVSLTMKEAVEAGLIKLETLRRVFRDQSRDYIRKGPVSYDHTRKDDNGKTIYGRSLVLLCEQGVSSNPLLQSVSFYWNNTEQFEADVRSVYPEASFM